jgi:hypothetical protein
LVINYSSSLNIVPIEGPGLRISCGDPASKVDQSCAPDSIIAGILGGEDASPAGLVGEIVIILDERLLGLYDKKITVSELLAS